jgi:hypothetical protein
MHTQIALSGPYKFEDFKSITKKAGEMSGFLHSGKLLSLGVLGSLSCLPQTDFLSLHRASIPGYESRFSQDGSKSFIVLHQRSGNSMPNCPGLTKATAAADRYFDTKLVSKINQLQRLTNDHSCGFTSKILVQRSIIDHD